MLLCIDLSTTLDPYLCGNKTFTIVIVWFKISISRYETIECLIATTFETNLRLTLTLLFHMSLSANVHDDLACIKSAKVGAVVEFAL